MSSFDFSSHCYGCDHAGFEYKTAIVSWLNGKGWQVKDFGPMPPILLIIPICSPGSEAVEKDEVAFVFYYAVAQMEWP